MDDAALLRWRLASLGLSPPYPGRTPVDVVRRLLAVQSQEAGPARWSLGQRLPGRVTEAGVDAAFAAGEFIRTHVLRPTWHFVAPEDLRWLLRLTAPRVHRASSYYYRQNDLDPATLARTAAVIGAAVGDGGPLTRKEVAARLAGAGIEAAAIRLNLIMIHAELEEVVCSGPPRGRQQTYALVDERVPPTTPGSPEARLETDRDAALATLARRYVGSHAPATAKDLSWWSGLTLGDARRGLELAELTGTEIGGVVYWSDGDVPAAIRSRKPRVSLVQAFDEHIVGYTESRGLLDPDRRTIGAPMVLRDGRRAGWWKRPPANGALVVDVTLDAPFDAAVTAALEAEAARLAAFAGLPLDLRSRSAGRV